MGIKTADGKVAEGLEQGRFEPVAVIGLGAIMPDAENVNEFWTNITQAKVSIKEVAPERWPGKVEDFWKSGGPGAIEEGYTYSKIGAFVENFEFNWRRWRQPPGTLGQIDPCQLWAVEVSAAALAHAGYDGESKDFDRSKCGVIFANALGGENRNLSNIRVWSNHTKNLAVKHGLPEENADDFKSELVEHSPRIDEDTVPGELANVVSGRVANLLNLQGPNYATDAACASSMAAILDACRLLQNRQVDLMLAGASDRTMDPATFAKFSAIGALSPSHSTPFDAKANGFVMGEGAGAIVLKRLADAIADGDTIHAVIRGVGGSSDGRGKGITAPSQRGQIQAIARAYQQAGYEPSTVELVEAHGTSTKVGDATELSSLSTLWTGLSNGNHVAVGSIKSQIGHLKAAAGIAGVIKAILALHNNTIPPSAGFETPNPTVEWGNIPFYVPTKAADWKSPQNNPRRAGISSFGFGGTNFHIALEAFDLPYHQNLVLESTTALHNDTPVATETPAILDVTAKPSMTHEELKSIEGGLLLLSASGLAELSEKLGRVSFEGPSFDVDPRGRRLSIELFNASKFSKSDSHRMAIIATSWQEFDKRVALALKAMDDKSKWGFLQAQGVMITDEPILPEESKIAHMYPGQGSQYVGMTFDLFKRYTSVQKVWQKSDETMVDVLDGETLSSFVLRTNLSKAELVESEQKLKQTEYTQPAMLTADLAIERLLNAHGQEPDMVAGHSLGEYGALMASGILNMDGALRASAARGTEMGSVQIEDKGLMASITAPYPDVAKVLDETEGYVIAANKNSPKMTVIAGESEPVKAAIAAFETLGFSTTKLATSHAFHSRIVAPANEPLRRFLETLEINWPKIPITANYDGEFYPMSGSDAKSAVLEKLAPQMASSVEWTSQMERMYDSGARIFVEVGPKRALSMFATQIFEGRPHLPIMTNHPKQGGIASFLTALAAIYLAGKDLRWPEGNSPELSEAFRAGPIEAHENQRQISKSITADAIPSNSINQVAVSTSQSNQSKAVPVVISTEIATINYVGDILGPLCGYPAKFCRGMVNLRTTLGLTDSQIDQIARRIPQECQVDSSYDVSQATTAADLARYIQTPPTQYLSKMSNSSATSATIQSPTIATGPGLDPIVISGVSLGLPGGDKVFSDDVFEKLVRGETCISEVTDDYKQRLLDKNIVRLIKGRDGSVNMERANEFADIPQLAGVKGAFDLAEEFGIDAKVVLAWDITTQLAVAAGLLALRDAGIPLTPVEQTGKGGLRLITNWQVPKIQRDRTGIVFASCFPGLQMAMKHAKRNGDDGDGRFDRRFLFQTLNMGHSQFAQYTGIRGPNTTINLACASATAAFGVAEDWITMGRADRVIIISADDVTGDDLWEWIGGGFAASGAASTHNVVEETALPFDRRRNGLILGMGAAAFVLERNSLANERGVQPIAELLGTTIANSAYHGTRLDVEHVAQTVDKFVTSMEQKWDINRHKIAPNTVFFSHETYTPARGGSAQSEVKALRSTFGDSANSLVIANTKGFTGHPMAVGIEDASMLYGMLTGKIPPIANHQEKDPELGDLNLSTGGYYPNLEYGLRFGAGFGSQIALSLVRKWQVDGDRIDGKKLINWVRNLAGSDDVVIRILDGKLVSYVDGNDNLHGGIQGDEWSVTQLHETIETPEMANLENQQPEATVVENTEQHESNQIESLTSEEKLVVNEDEVVTTVIEVVVKHTGYPADFVELDQDLEGELGIDTVKQAEIMAEIRSIFGLPVDEDFVLADYPTLNHMIGYIGRMSGNLETVGEAIAAPIIAVDEVVEAVPPHESKISAAPAVDDSELIQTVIDVVVQHTGYPADFIELDQDLEGELGIDTVKQAEIMADIRTKFSLPLDEDFVLADYPTLNHMIGYIQQMLGNDSTVAEVAQVANEVVSQPATISDSVEVTPMLSQGHEDIEAKLVEVVVKHTGYPADFIEMDQDLEGELGIDTVKQAEIMAEVRDIFSLPVDEDFVLSDHPTLNHFTAYIVKMSGITQIPESKFDDTLTIDSASETEPGEIVTPQQNTVQVPSESKGKSSGCRRWQVEIEECAGLAEPLELSGTVVVTDDGWGIAEEICQKLEQRGLTAVRVGFESEIRDMSILREGNRTVYRADPANIDHINQVGNELKKSEICGIIHLAALKLAGVEWSEDTYPSSQITLAAHGWFSLLKVLDQQLSEVKPGIVASVTTLDGRHGNIGELFNSIQCSASGITKSYSFEQPHIRCRALDLHPEIVLDAARAAEIITVDILNTGGEVEIGIDRDERRWTLVAFDEQLEADREPLNNTDTWIVSGGGSGVTAASVIGVAQASTDANAHFILLGRSQPIDETQTWIDWTEEQLAERKLSLRDSLVEESEDGKVTMVEWNKAWQRFTRSRDVFITLDCIEKTGNKARYHSVDVMDQVAMVELGESFNRKITGVVHGAGLEDSKLVADKDYDVFDRVIRVKLDGWKSLMALVDASGAKSLRFAACFTSVAGRFGNGGQTDYAAANSVLDAEMARLSASGKCRAVAIAWTGWQDVGMATRGSIEAVFAAAGIETLDVDTGVNIFVDEALAGGKRRVIGCGSLGLMDRFDSFREPPLRLPSGMASIIADPTRFALIDKVVTFEEATTITTETTLSTELHPFLIDHAIDGTPYHPGVMALEMFAENALLLNPSTCLAGFENVKFGLPIKLMKGETKVRVIASNSKSSNGMHLVNCRIVSDLMNSKGEIFGENEHHSATVRLVEKSDDLTQFLYSEVDKIPSIGIPALEELTILPSFIYQRYFHGPRFQSHGGVMRGVGNDDTPGADGIALMRNQLPIREQFACEVDGEEVLLEALPMLIEAGFQNAGFVAMESEGFSSLPIGIEWSTVLRVPDRNEILRMRSLRVAVEDGGITVHDVVIVGDDDGPVLAMRGLRLKSMAPVPDEQRFILER